MVGNTMTAPDVLADMHVNARDRHWIGGVVR